MNPLLSNQNLFVLRTINVKKPDENKFMVINEFEGFTNFVENELAVKIFYLICKASVIIYRWIHIQAVFQSDFMILTAMARRGMNTPGSRFQGDMVAHYDQWLPVI